VATTIIIVPLILAPLPDIPVHIIKSPLIGNTKRSNGNGMTSVLANLSIPVGVSSIIVDDCRVNLIAKEEGAGGPGTRGILPLGLARKAEAIIL
jgi:hypothetical protein